MSRLIERTSAFKRNYKHIRHDPKVLEELAVVLGFLASDAPLPEKYCDHPLHNNWEGCRDCHIRPDVVLVYRKTEDGLVLLLLRIGSHSEVFK